MTQLIHGLPALHTGNSCIDQFCCMYSKSYPSAWLSSWRETPDGAPPKRYSRLKLNLWVLSFQAPGPLSGSWQFSRTSCSGSIYTVRAYQQGQQSANLKQVGLCVGQSVGHCVSPSLLLHTTSYMSQYYPLK